MLLSVWSIAITSGQPQAHCIEVKGMDPRSVLSFPSVFRQFTRLIGGNYRAAYVDQFLRPRPGDRVLDVGCGTGDILDYLPNLDYTGIDISDKYISAAKKRFGAKGRFICMPLEELAIDDGGMFDIVMANGVVHHLDDEDAIGLFRFALKALKSSGRMVTFDGCFVKGQAWLASRLLRMDRGKHVRSADSYLQLASQVFVNVHSEIRHDLLRLPYSHLIMECRP
jgi:SAM-dependent methyltransferase